MRPRDTQRQRLYDAERDAFGRTADGYTVEQMQALIDKWRSSKTLCKRYPRAKLPVKVTDGRSRRRGAYSYGKIAMPRAARSKRYLLHELAHHLVIEGPAHGWQYAECYLYLVRVFMGRSAEEALKREFKAHRVRFRAPRRSTMTDAQREAARQRMLAMHAERQAQFA
jgi:hypothetical protein